MPTTRSFSLSHVKRTYSAELVDPPSKRRREPTTIDFEEGAILEGYYGALIKWLDEGAVTIGRDEFRLVVKLATYDPVDQEYVHLGMVDRGVSMARRRQMPESQRPYESPDTYVGSDGIAVVTSKTPEVR